jgi:hypothetical protein
MSDTTENLQSREPPPQHPRSRALTIFLSQATFEILRGLATENKRSLSAQARWVLRRYCEYPEALST